MSIPSKQFDDLVQGSIEKISFQTFELKQMSFRSNDLGSMMSMYNPAVQINIAKNTKKKEDNACVSYNSI